MRGATTLRYLAALDGWESRFRYGAFALARKLRLPVGIELMLGSKPDQEIIERDGYRFRPRPQTADLVALLPIHELLTRNRIARHLASNHSGVFVDVGAHCGSFSILLERLFSKVIAIEPLPLNQRALAVNLQLNDLEMKIEVIACAASDLDGEATLKLFGDDTPSLIGDASTVKTLPVQVRRIDAILLERGLRAPSISVLKIDVEGAECSVLRGAERLLAEGSPLVVAEANDAVAEQALRGEMKSRGYVCEGMFDSRNLIFNKSS